MDHISPFVVTLRNGGRKRLFRHDNIQDDMVSEVRQDSLPLCCQLRTIRSNRIATTFLVSLEREVLVFEHDWRVIHAGGAELICQVEFCGRSSLNANIGAFQCVESGGGFTYDIFAGHDRLSIIERDRTKCESKFRIASPGPCAVAAEDIHLTGLKSRKAILRAQRAEFNCIRVIEQGGRPGAAEIDIKSSPRPGRIQKAEALEGAVNSANHIAAIKDGLQAFSSSNRRGNGGRFSNATATFRSHFHRNNDGLLDRYRFPCGCGSCSSTSSKHDACERQNRYESHSLTHILLLEK